MTSELNPVAQELHLPVAKNSFKNRIIKSPMTECMASAWTNSPSMKHVRLYEEWAKRGNPAALITGNIMVDRRYLEAPNNVVVDDERDLKILRKWAEHVHKHDVKLIAQISHPGRQCPMSVTYRPVAPSEGAGAVKMILPAFFPPRGLQIEEIYEIQEMFTRAAHVLWKAGFDGVEIHSAHGYLLSQFLSPKWNKRTDKYGGPLENRSRLLKDIIRSIRETIKDEKFILCVKLNTADFQQGGFSEEESMQVIKDLCHIGVDFVELSGGNYENTVFMQNVKKVQRESSKLREAFFIDYVTKLQAYLKKNKTKIPIMLSGGFRHLSAMKTAISSGVVDIVGIARPFCLEPEKISLMVEGIREEEIQLPSSNIGFQNSLLAKLNSGMENLWHQRQMWLMAEGKNPDESITRFWLLTSHVFYTYIFHPGRVSKSTWAISFGVLAFAVSYFVRS